jgi:hypothetical protein
MSAHFSAVAEYQPRAVAGHASLQLRRFDQWIADIADHIGELEDHIRERSLAGEDTAPESFSLQKMELLLDIAREAKSRI